MRKIGILQWVAEIMCSNLFRVTLIIPAEGRALTDTVKAGGPEEAARQVAHHAGVMNDFTALIWGPLRAPGDYAGGEVYSFTFRDNVIHCNQLNIVAAERRADYAASFVARNLD